MNAVMDYEPVERHLINFSSLLKKTVPVESGAATGQAGPGPALPG